MMRSLYSGISGLRSHQIKMDVIANNVANVNTVGFKRSRLTFSDLFNETLKEAVAPDGESGGINPIQVGTGVKVASIDQIFTQGSFESTGKNSDVAIDGEGFFILDDGQGGKNYTRAGNFDIDGAGYLVHTATGMRVFGWEAQKNSETGLMYLDTNREISQISFLPGEKLSARATELVEYRSNLDETATERNFPEEGELQYGTKTPQENLSVKFEKLTETIYKFSVRDMNDNPVDLLTTVAGAQVDATVELFEDGTIKDVKVDGVPINEFTVTANDAYDNRAALPGYIGDTFDIVRSPSEPPKVSKWLYKDQLGNEQELWMKTTAIGGNTYEWRIYDENNQPIDLDGDGTIDEINDDFGLITMSNTGSILSFSSPTAAPGPGGEAAGAYFVHNGNTVSITIVNDQRTLSMTETSTENYREINIGSQTLSFEFQNADDVISFDVIAGQKHSTSIAVYDSLGEAHEMIMNYEKLDDNKWRYFASFADDDSIVLDYLEKNPDARAGEEFTADEREAVMENLFWDIDKGNTRSGIIIFNELGRIDQDATRAANNVTQPAITEKLYFDTPRANNVTIDLDFLDITQYDYDFTTAARYQDGYEMGMLESYGIDPDGAINGIYSNGHKQTIGKIALSVFYNPGGLRKVGDTMWEQTPNSGHAVIAQPGIGKAGEMQSGTLEMSNVDLAQEFTDMIVAQRGFQANSRSITTSDQMLQELVNLKR